ncbi:transglycosylase family protein [Streptomyces sp. NPDC006367]|uniref:transglycosylase family protein n=1 Tax=unclassified Streptomyces TaxID=2593676 RepID=UPI0033B181EF
MLSGNGRHRRPRQAPALVVAAGVTGSAIAIPLLGATGAHAADGTSWDRVAECETGGAWSQNSGNGYYGGLQLSQDLWEQYGGLAYAPSADEASRSQQISVAEKVLAGQGVAAWPTCGPLAGLGGGAGAATGGTGTSGDGSSAGERAPGASGSTDPSETTASPEATETAGSAGSAARPSSPASPSPSSTPAPSASTSATADVPSDNSDKTAKGDTPGTSATPGLPADGVTRDSGGAGTEAPESDAADKSGQNGAVSGLVDTEESPAGRHRGGSADEGAAAGREDAPSGRHASRGEGGARDLTDGAYTVRSGDSLWGIADSLDVSGGWHALYAENEEVVGADPNHILPGQTLTVTGESVENQG